MMRSDHALERSTKRTAKCAVVAMAIASLALAAALTISTMLYGALWKFEWSWFYPWVLSPYLALGIVILVAGNRTKANQVASLIASVLVLLFASLMYVDAMFIHVSSTSALIFIFAPLYLLVGGLVIFIIAALVARKLIAQK